MWNSIELIYRKRVLGQSMKQAILDGRLDIVERLVRQGESVDAVDVNDHNSTPLHYAVCKDRLDIVNFLISKRANINAVDQSLNTPLHYAAYRGNFEMVKYLMAQRAGIRLVNRHGQTPLHCAIEMGHNKIAKHFMYNGVKLGDTDGPDGLLEYALRNNNEEMAEALNLAVEHTLRRTNRPIAYSLVLMGGSSSRAPERERVERFQVPQEAAQPVTRVGNARCIWKGRRVVD